MALKILAEIETDKGLTSEAYVRIASYTISKYGTFSIYMEVFQNEADSKLETLAQNVHEHLVKNKDLLDGIYVTLKKMVGDELVTDISGLEGVDIFKYGYNILKQKLVDLYGEQNVIDC